MANKQKDIARTRRKQRVRKKVLGTDQRPRISVFKSNKHIYAQVISDDRGMTLASISTLSKDLAAKVENIKGVEAAKQVGLALAKICKEKYYAGYLRSQRVSLSRAGQGYCRRCSRRRIRILTGLIERGFFGTD